jgi:dihydrofolate reductase
MFVFVGYGCSMSHLLTISKILMLRAGLCYDKPMKAIVVAYDKNRGIGAANDLLWKRSLPADLRHFKTITSGGAVIMGRKTFESIGHPLPGRQNIVISRKMPVAGGVWVVRSLKAAYEAVEPGRDAFVIGGGQIYEQALETVDTIIATEVDATFAAADTFFPPIRESAWYQVNRLHHKADEHNGHDFDFVTYRHY